MHKVLFDSKSPQGVHGVFVIVLADGRNENSALIQRLENLCNAWLQREVLQPIFNERSVPEGIIQIPYYAFADSRPSPSGRRGVGGLRIGCIFHKVNRAKVQGARV